MTADAPGRAQLARRAGVVSAAVLASRVLGLVREQVFAVSFGAGKELDAFITSRRISATDRCRG
jgi:putative peptidoglycan lipid II flippase